MVTTQKSVREALFAGGSASGKEGGPAAGWRGLAALALACLALLAGCGESPAQRKLARGLELLRAHRAAEAVTPLREAVDLFATNQTAQANALNYLGLAYHQSGQLDEASRAYAAALNADLNLVEARYNRGCLFLETGDLPGALRELGTFLEFRPDSARGWLQLGRVKYRMGQYVEAAEAFRRATKLAASRTIQAQALNGAGLCRAREGRVVEAMKFFGAALKLDPALASARLNQAIIAERNHDLLGALEDYQTWLETATNAPLWPRVSDHVRGLARQLQPELPSLAADARELKRLTNLFLRVGHLVLPHPPGEAAKTSAPPVAVAATSPPPALTPTGAPPVAVAAASNPPAAAVSTTAPPPAPVRTSAPLPMLVLTSPPPATVTTSPAPAVASVSATNAPAPAASNVIAAAAPPPETTNAPPETPAKPVIEESVNPPPELVVALPPEPPPAAASPEPPAPAAPPSPSADTAPSAPTGREPVLFEKPASPAPSEPPPPEKKKSFWAKINPVHWFRKDGGQAKEEKPPEEKKKTKKKGRITPLSPGGQTAPAGSTNPPVATASAPAPTPAPTPAPPELPAEPAPEPARPAFARYQYLSPPKPKPGDVRAARALFLRGAKAHREGRLDEAATAYRRAIAADPACCEARYNLGTLALNRQEYGLALQQLETALVIAPTNTTARFNFAVALEEAGFLLDAETELQRVLKAEPNNVEAHLALAGLYADLLHQPDKARPHFERVLQLAPSHPQADAIRRWLAHPR